MRDLLAHLLAGAEGGNKKDWRRLIGPIGRLPI
jgi:hypothetical protein